MKKFIFLLTTIFICTIAYAETITINWGVDNQPYTTTTCEIGGDVVLPPVSKRGHIFKGWIAEHFNRGTFVNWANVPKKYAEYHVDVYDNTTPLENDYMIVENTNDYIPDNLLFVINARQDKEGSVYFKNVTVNYKNNTYYHNKIEMGQTVILIPGIVKVVSTSDNWRYIALQDIVYNGNLYHAGDVFYSRGSWWFTEISVKASLVFDKYSGAWKFVYHGNWESDGRNGWTPFEQIGE